MSKNLGFESIRNLEESEKDREILNNLGGGDIASDISLFINNTQNVSVLEWEYNTDGSSIASNKFIFPTTVPFVFTTADKVEVTTAVGNLNVNTTYYVVGLDLKAGSRGTQVAFGLSTTLNGPLVTLGSITTNVNFTRAELVTQENLINIAKPLIEDSETNILGNDFNYLINNSFNQAFDNIESNVDTFNFLREFKYVSNDSTSIDRNPIFEGIIEVSDPANFNASEADLGADKSPGVYISDPFSDVLSITKTRAFSSDSNPWLKVGDELVTESTKVNIGDLYFSNGITINSIVDFNTVDSSVVASAFTHKIPIVIDNVEYFLLLKS
jgi:hypothetical protein